MEGARDNIPMMEVRCCCKPENLIGYLPAVEYIGKLSIRELDDGSLAFTAENHDHLAVKFMPGFVEAESEGKKKKWRR